MKQPQLRSSDERDFGRRAWILSKVENGEIDVAIYLRSQQASKECTCHPDQSEGLALSLPDNTRTAGPAASPRDDSRNRASAPHDALLIEIGERPCGIVLCLERAVMLAAVQRPERVGRVIAVGIERFDAAQSRHLGFDHSVEMSGAVRLVALRDIPEAEVHVKLAGLQRVESEAIRLRGGPDRTGPHRIDANLALEKIEK